ncbi:MAG: MerR family DNA-binding protein [Caulobacteraceae bacterium]|nr:MerR family DNA-binding protein [Caulobacteraceae bacterium]
MTIGETAARTRCTPPPSAIMRKSGSCAAWACGAIERRAYGHPELHRLRFIRRCRDLGFPIEDVRALLDVDGRQRRLRVCRREI